MEGLRLLPHFQASQDTKHLRDCDACKQRETVTKRQHMGCGYEAPLPEALGTARPWTPHWWVMQGWDASICPGYSTTLPEVVEVTYAYGQWEAGTLTEWVASMEGEAPSRALLDALAMRKAGINERQHAEYDERERARGQR